MKANTLSLRKTESGLYFVYNLTTKENTGHYLKKTKKGAINHAKKLWKNVTFV